MRHFVHKITVRPVILSASVLSLICALPISAFALDNEHTDLTQLSVKLKKGETSAAAILADYQQQIKLLNPQVNAVMATRPQAVAEAQLADKSKKYPYALSGLPIMLKDNIEVAGMVTTAGSLVLADNMASTDAHIVQRLRKAGAIIAGKTNLSEWANFRSTKSTSGWSSAGGQTRNPYDTSKTPCGSSAGSGAAVAARMIPAAIGTETDGSVTCPASINGLVGLKPTLGLVSRSGIIPLSHSQDTAGPMTLSVRDAALLMNVISGSDPSDPTTKDADKMRSPDYLAGLDKNALKGKRLGVVTELVKIYDAETKALFQRSLAILKAQGAIIVEQVEIPHLKEIDKDELQVLLYDFKTDLNAYLAKTPQAVKARNMADVMAFNTKNAAKVMPYFGQEIMEKSNKLGPLTEKAYVEASFRAKKNAGVDGIDAALKKHKLDALIAPTTSAAWSINYKTGDDYVGSATSPAAISGYPHLTVPMGLVKGLPIGISFFASAWSDAALLNMGYAFEQARPEIPAPKLSKK
jgi:amidase